jgi:hypothetical protein
MKMLRLFLIVVFAFFTNMAFAKDATAVGVKSPIVQTQIKSKSESEYARYASYSIDGITSASKLAAQRSHTVAGKDERNFAIFTGITAILMIYFFSQFEFFDK